jgi:hypothetical protein
MKKKLPFYYFWDLKSVLWSIGVTLVIAGIVVIGFLPEIVRTTRIEDLRGETIGEITTLKENTIIRQGKLGSRVVVDSYEVSYVYNVENMTYNKTEIIRGNAKLIAHLNNIKENIKPKEIKVRYDLKNPSQSLINIE